jgi:hypothetical protein
MKHTHREIKRSVEEARKEKKEKIRVPTRLSRKIYVYFRKPVVVLGGRGGRFYLYD